MPTNLPSSKATLIALRIADVSRRASTLAKIAIVEAESQQKALDTIGLARRLAESEQDSMSRCRALCDVAFAEHVVGLDCSDTLQSAEQAAMDATGDVRPLIHLYLTRAKIGLHPDRNLQIALEFARASPDESAADDALLPVIRAAAELGRCNDAEDFVHYIQRPMQRIAAYCEIALAQNDCRPDRQTHVLDVARQLLDAIESPKETCEAQCLLAVADGLTGGNPEFDLTQIQMNSARVFTSDDQLYIRCQLAAAYAQLARWSEAEAELKLLPTGPYRDAVLTTFISEIVRAGDIPRAVHFLEKVTAQSFIDAALNHIALAEARFSHTQSV